MSKLASELRSLSAFPVMDYRGPTDIARIDLSERNLEFTAIPLQDAAQMCRYIERELTRSGRKYLAGGYGEDRAIYRQSAVFGGEEPRTVHLGIDIWGPAGEPVYSPITGRIHSFRDNAGFGDYGPTLLLEHETGGERFYSLYGHLSRESMPGWEQGREVAAGERVGWLGSVEVNGGWAPHLHFQLIRNLSGAEGDFPGVAARSRAAEMLANCPDPEWLLKLGL